MNRRPLNSLPLGKAITGFVNYKTAEGLSDRSVDSYKRILEHWAEYAGNKHVAQFTDHDINAYLVYMRTDYIPSRWSGDTRTLSPKTLRNIWITMCSFFRWANTEFQIENPMKQVPAPRFQKVEIEPFTREEVAQMLKACTYSREADTSFRRQFVMRRPTANRDQAVILTWEGKSSQAISRCFSRPPGFWECEILEGNIAEGIGVHAAKASSIFPHGCPAGGDGLSFPKGHQGVPRHISSRLRGPPGEWN